MKRISRILFPTDFSKFSKGAQNLAVEWARAFRCPLTVLHVFEPPFYSHSGVSAGVSDEVHRWINATKRKESGKLDRLVQGLRKKTPKVKGVFREGIPFVEIIKAADDLSADMIVLGTHGRTGLSHMILGSVAEKVVQRSPCPVLTVRPKGFFTGKRPKRRN